MNLMRGAWSKVGWLAAMSGVLGAAALLYFFRDASWTAGSLPWSAVLTSEEKGASAKELPWLMTQGNWILRADTLTPVILRGALTDYFRFGEFNLELGTQPVEMELQRIRKLEQAGGNLIGLYLADTDALIARAGDLDRVIRFAEENGLYVYLIPVAREYDGRDTISDGSRQETFEDLKRLMDFLATRYADRSNVIYGFGAEPETENFEEWLSKQLELGRIVRAKIPKSLLLVTAPIRTSILKNYLHTPFPMPNVVYMGSYYLSQNDAEIADLGAGIEERLARVWMDDIARTYPYLAGEFGGNTGSDFSSRSDLAVIKLMLKGLADRDLSYTMYKLSPDKARDPLAVFDTEGNITRRGEVFFEALRGSPGTSFW